MAAYNISGQTLHRFFGMANQSTVPNYNTLNQYVKLYPKIILLIDEYSMISAELVQIINDALIKTTQRATLMGGIKTIFFGDIAQLLPVKKANEGSIWQSGIHDCVNRYNLNTHIRQQDEEFVNILNKVRVYDFDQSVIEFINRRTIPKSQLPPCCLRLYTTRERVRTANETDFIAFPGDAQEIKAHDYYVGSKGTALHALKETRLLEILQLKENMPVMLIQNLNVNLGWVNGTLATVEFVEEENICLKRTIRDEYDNPKEVIYWVQRITRQVPGTSYTRSQFPIVPAFASTIHKAQSVTIDCVGIHLDNMLTHGQLYVAMSRVRKAEDLFFFGAETPLSIKRMYGCDVDAVEIIRKKIRTK